MNQELKLKMHSIYGQLLVEKKLMQAWKQVKENKGCGGIDGETLDTFAEKEEEKINKLLTTLKEKRYVPKPVKRVYIPKKNGKKRPLGIPTIEDRIVQQSVVNVINPKFENEIFHRWSCGYRKGLGAERTMQIILWNLERGYNHIYDCDIKGFFDNIPHKKLMKILTKYIADGTVLDMMWKWLKAGHMQEGKYHIAESGTPQGGVISPILANIYLNELDWELDKENIRFVRYADDFLLFAKTEEEIKRAGDIANRIINDLGLEVSMEKTRKSLTLSTKAWLDRLNPIIRGKINYYLNIFKAVKANEEYGQRSRCILKAFSGELHAVDSYVRQRLRVAMIHKNPCQRKGWLMTSKWNNEYFVKIGLIPCHWLYYNKMWGYTLDMYLEKITTKNKLKLEKKIKKLKEKGQEYYTPDRLFKINAVKSYV